MKKPITVVFVGGKDRGYECIRMLYDRKETLLHIFCMPEDEHEKVKYLPKIVGFAKAKHIPITVTKSINNANAYATIKALQPDIILVMGWRTIIPKDILTIPKYGVAGAHESLLPAYRGFAPINWAVINGEKYTGVTLFYLDEGIDSGDIIAQRKIPIGPEETAWEIYQKATRVSLLLVGSYLTGLKQHTVKRKKQNEKRATYTVARVPGDGLIPWSWNTKRISNFIRALSFPFPGAFTYYRNRKIIIQKARPFRNPPRYIGGIPGRVAMIGKGYVNVITGDGLLSIRKIETPEGQVVDASVYITSIKGTLKDE